MTANDISKIEGKCPSCLKQYEFNLTEVDFSNKLNPNDPSEVSFLKRIGGDDKIALKVMDHDSHLFILEINHELQIQTKLVVDKTKIGMDTLVNENVNACRTINSMLETESVEYKPRVLFISEMDYFLKFIQSQLSLMILCGDDFDFEKRKHYLSVYYDNFVYTVGKIEYLKTLQPQIKHDDNPVRLKSLVIDTSVYSNDLVINYLKKWKVELLGVKVILVYNSSTIENLRAQFDLRDQLYDVFKAETVSLGDIAKLESRRYVNIEAIISITMNENLAKSYIQNQLSIDNPGIV